GQPGGWDGDPGSHLTSVGCEACHGPSGPHDGTATEPRTTCEGCHDEKHSIAFSYDKGLPLIDHYAANGMTDEDFRARLEALGSGRAPRPLLAFAQGKNVGADACKECHAEEHASWSASPHASAMDALAQAYPSKELAEGEAAGKAECVQCHATAKTSGPPPKEVENFHVGEGVSCESCHGPGETHVAEGGGKDNIEGLGEDCPVCVIEAVCTSCHTPDWDATWDLDTHLPKVGHGK
ncbi:MAG: hypothetical protein EP330_05045, partial [Deltaproteobacteria bacterium]